MDFELSDEQCAIRNTARAVAAAALGFDGMHVRVDVGGAEIAQLDAALIFEALSAGDVSTPASLPSTIWRRG